MFVEFSKAIEGKSLKQAMTDWLVGWNCGQPLNTIKRAHVEEFFAEAFMQRLYRRLNDSEKTEIQAYISEVERTLDHKFAPGNGPFPTEDHPLYRYKLSVRARHRPLAFYLFISLGSQLVYMLFRKHGLKHYHTGHIKYWHKKATTPEAERLPPIVFFHGICPGIGCYFPLLKRIWRDREIFIVELPWVAMNPFAEFPDRDEFCSDVDLMLSVHHHESAFFVGHSYGTFVCKWMHARYPRLFNGLVLLDPVSILIFAPFVTSNFVFAESLKKKKSHEKISQFRAAMANLKVFMHNLGSRELGIAKTVTRHIVWYDDNFFADELPQNSSVILSEKDRLIPAGKIARYFEHHNEEFRETNPDKMIHVETLLGVPHGGMLLMSGHVDHVAEVILERSSA